MGVAKSIEQRLEGLVEGFFTKVFRSGLQPVEVGRRILRELAENKTISVNRVYVPNEFHVAMSSDDFQRFDQMATGLQREFSELVIESAKENRWNLMGMPKIVFVEEADLGRGEFRVEPSLSADPDVPAPQASTQEPDPDGGSTTGAVSTDTASRLALTPRGPRLAILDDDGAATENITLTRDPIVVGRMSSSDVVLSDPNVSRRHAELRRTADGWVVVDLGSTNGTLVNGNLAREHRLNDGDKLTFGSTEIRFEAE
ncbi:MAG: FhaA domain-containing protein [Actinomycetota bacterium]